jgi:hypothetical protein
MLFKSLVPSVTLNNLSEYLEDILDYQSLFKTFTTPFEEVYSGIIHLDDVDRIYSADISDDDDDTGDSLYNVSFRFIGGDKRVYYAYAHMRINYGFDIDDEFIRGTMFMTKQPLIFFMTTVSSIDETDSLYAFLLDDGIDICFDEDETVQMLHSYYMLQIVD